jgi:hypothetical protein
MQTSEKYNVIRQAIINKHQIVAIYQGYVREMCPHCIGWKNGKEQALFYQFGGSSERGLGADGSSANWRCIPIAGLFQVEEREGEWHTCKSSHSRPQTCVGQIDVEVKI